MTWIEAVILGIVQGLTEFLPVSSSGHLEIGTVLLGIETSENLLFSIVVHGATALSTIIVFRKDIWVLIRGTLSLKWNESTQYVFKIAVSMIPVFIVGVFFEDEVEALFGGKIVLVACMLLVTGTLLFITHYIKSKEKEVSFFRAIIIGIAQAIAIFPGISRSGATITTALFLGVEKSKAARFSFLMVLPPILGATLLEALKFFKSEDAHSTITAGALTAGFVAAFIAGILACQWMINLVKKGKLIYFALYCFALAIIALVLTL